MARTYKSNNEGQNELQAAAHEAGASVAAPTSDKPKKVWDCYLNTEVGIGQSREESKMLGAFEFKAGRSKKDNTPYFFLSGYSKEQGGMSIGLTKKVDVLIAKLVDAGFETVICKVLEDKGILK